MFTDVGIEGGFMIPPDAITVIDSSFSTASALYFTWMVKARPHPLAEPTVFTPVRDRLGHVYIWHRIDGQITCNCGSPSVSLSLSGSRFPSAAVYFRVDGSGPSLGAYNPQGAMARLWDPDPFDPTLVR
jgi:hypothetical protein